MMYKSIVIALLAAATPSICAPLSARQSNDTIPATYNTTAPVPAPTATDVPANAYPTAPAPQYTTVLPKVTSTYHGNNGAVDYKINQAIVSRHTWNNGRDTSALVTFEIPAEYASKQCQFIFDMSAPSSWASGTKQADIYTSLAPATASTTSWPQGNLRDSYLGRLQVNIGGFSTIQAGPYGKFPCSIAAGKIFGGEVVPVGDDVEISWVVGVNGPKIIVY
jgi:hypothetical protein